jgi:hypothetical protein
MPRERGEFDQSRVAAYTGITQNQEDRTSSFRRTGFFFLDPQSVAASDRQPSDCLDYPTPAYERRCAFLPF